MFFLVGGSVLPNDRLHKIIYTLSLARDGVLIYETFAHGNERFGKPSNPDFLLAAGELLKMNYVDPNHFLRTIAYEDGYIDLPKPAMVQRICAIKGESNISPDRLRLI